MQSAKQKLPKRIKQKVEKTPKEIKLKLRKPPKSPSEKKPKEKKEKIPMTPEKKKSVAKNIVIIVLVIAIIAQSAILVTTKLKSGNTDTAAEQGGTEFVINLDVSGIANTALDTVSETAVGAINDIKNNITPQLDIKAKAQEIIYSDAIVNTIMSMSFPLLYKVLTDLNMMDFAENVDLYPTPAKLAPLFQGHIVQLYECKRREKTAQRCSHRSRRR